MIEVIMLIPILYVTTAIVLLPFAIIGIILQLAINPITIEDSDDVQ